jgi:hypothetical protein
MTVFISWALKKLVTEDKKMEFSRNALNGKPRNGMEKGIPL